MRVLSLAMCAILAAGAFLSIGAIGSSAALADASGTAVSAQSVTAPLPAQTLGAQTATRAEERDYAAREAQSPAAVKNYTGGFVFALLTLVVLVLLIVFLVNRT